jgi:hypothetical protein
MSRPRCKELIENRINRVHKELQRHRGALHRALEGAPSLHDGCDVMRELYATFHATEKLPYAKAVKNT